MAGKKPFRKQRPGKEAKEYDEEVIEIRRVTRVVKGGRRLRFRALVVIGNRKGKVGIGVGKSTEVTGAIQKAISQAKKNVKVVTLNEETIPHEVKIKYKSARILLIPAGPGTGIIAGGTVRKVLELAGVKNILSKIIGSSNKLNNTYAAFEALKTLETTPGMLKKKKKAEEKPAAPAAPAPDKAAKPAPEKAPKKDQKPASAEAPKEAPKKEEPNTKEPKKK
jgi:small subunit ribosomal protein S5